MDRDETGKWTRTGVRRRDVWLRRLVTLIQEHRVAVWVSLGAVRAVVVKDLLESSFPKV